MTCGSFSRVGRCRSRSGWSRLRARSVVFSLWPCGRWAVGCSSVFPSAAGGRPNEAAEDAQSGGAKKEEGPVIDAEVVDDDKK